MHKLQKLNIQNPYDLPWNPDWFMGILILAKKITIPISYNWLVFHPYISNKKPGIWTSLNLDFTHKRAAGKVRRAAFFFIISAASTTMFSTWVWYLPLCQNICPTEETSAFVGRINGSNSSHLPLNQVDDLPHPLVEILGPWELMSWWIWSTRSK